MRKLTTAICLTAIALAGFTTTVFAEMEIVFAISTPQGAMGQVSGQRLTDMVNEKLAGKAKLVYFHSAQLGPDKSLMQKLKINTIQLTHMASVMPSYVEEAAIFDMPFLVKDREHVLRIEKEWLWKTFAPAAEKKGYKLIALWENGFRQITNNIRPINTPADLQGIKIRTPRSEWRVAMFKAFGANPTPMPFSEVFVGLQTGVIDAQENPLTHIAANQLQEVQKYLSLSGHVYSPVFLLAYKEHWEKIPADIRKVIEDTAQEIRPWIYETVAAADERLVGELESKGMEVNKVNRDEFVKASAPVYELFDKKIPGGKAMIEEILELAQ